MPGNQRPLRESFHLTPPPRTKHSPNNENMTKWSPDLIAGVTIALAAFVVGFGGTLYCWFHKKMVKQGEVSTVDKWLTKGGTGMGFAGVHAGYAEGIDMERPRRQRDPERDAALVPGVDNMGDVAAPPPVYSPHEQGGISRASTEVPDYQESHGRDNTSQAR